jgi:DNA-binding PadR family transcriptional regulator
MTVPRMRSGLSLGEYAILGMLRHRAMHGYQIAHRFTSDLDLGVVLPLDMSTVYGLLKDLQEQGLIDGQRETVGLRPPRTVFHLTAEAEALFLQWLEEPVARLREVRSDFLVKLYFCRTISVTCTERLLTAQIAATTDYLQRLVALQAETPIDTFQRLVYDSKIVAARATVTWLEDEWRRLVG